MLEHALHEFVGFFSLGYLFLSSFKQFAWLLVAMSMKGYEVSLFCSIID